MPQFYQLLAGALQEGTPFALGVITSIKGSSPQKKGAKALFLPDGRILGTLGGGCLEAEIQDRARRALLTGQPASFDLVLDHDFGWDDGLICGGRVSGLILPGAAGAAELWRALQHPSESVTWGIRDDHSIAIVSRNEAVENGWLYQETVHPPCQLWIAGSGHVAQAVVPLALPLEFDVTVFDDRPSLANTRHFPAATRFEVGPWETLFEVEFPRQPAFGLIVTRGHQHDALVLARWISRPFVFLGMIGSRRKRRILFDQFAADRIATPEQLAAVACPVGLEIHAVSVQEIALSVMAQYVAIRAEKVTRVGSPPRTECSQP